MKKNLISHIEKLDLPNTINKINNSILLNTSKKTIEPVETQKYVKFDINKMKESILKVDIVRLKVELKLSNKIKYLENKLLDLSGIYDLNEKAFTDLNINKNLNLNLNLYEKIIEEFEIQDDIESFEIIHKKLKKMGKKNELQSDSITNLKNSLDSNKKKLIKNKPKLKYLRDDIKNQLEYYLNLENELLENLIREENIIKDVLLGEKQKSHVFPPFNIYKINLYGTDGQEGKNSGYFEFSKSNSFKTKIKVLNQPGKGGKNIFSVKSFYSKLGNSKLYSLLNSFMSTFNSFFTIFTLYETNWVGPIIYEPIFEYAKDGKKVVKKKLLDFEEENNKFRNCHFKKLFL